MKEWLVLFVDHLLESAHSSTLLPLLIAPSVFHITRRAIKLVSLLIIANGFRPCSVLINAAHFGLVASDLQ
jgi:hypothetical protein